MAESSQRFSRARFTGEEVVSLLDLEGEDGGLEDEFLPGSDDELGFLEEEEEEDDVESDCEEPKYVIITDTYLASIQ